MIKFAITFALFACAYAASPESTAEVKSNEFELTHPEGYRYKYETSNGIVGSVEAVYKQVDKENVESAVSGSVSYTDPDGHPVYLRYVADKDGYRPEGEHLPTPPPTMPIPSYIQSALQYIAEHPYTEKVVKKN